MLTSEVLLDWNCLIQFPDPVGPYPGGATQHRNSAIAPCSEELSNSCYVSSNIEDLLPLKDLSPTVLHTESPGSKGNRKSRSSTGQPEHSTAPHWNTRHLHWGQTGAGTAQEHVGGTSLGCNIKGSHQTPHAEHAPELHPTAVQANPPKDSAQHTAPCSFSLNQESSLLVAQGFAAQENTKCYF